METYHPGHGEIHGDLQHLVWVFHFATQGWKDSQLNYFFKGIEEMLSKIQQTKTVNT